MVNQGGNTKDRLSSFVSLVTKGGGFLHVQHQFTKYTDVEQYLVNEVREVSVLVNHHQVITSIKGRRVAQEMIDAVGKIKE